MKRLDASLGLAIQEILDWPVFADHNRDVINRGQTTDVASFGAAFPTFYRLVGPFKSSTAPGIVKTELWDTIKRRGVLGNLFMGVIPMVRSFFVSLFLWFE